MFPYEIFRHCKTKILRRKILIPPLFSIEFFATGNFLKHSREGLACETFRHIETAKFRRKILICPPWLSTEFFATGKFLKRSSQMFPRKHSGTVRQILCRWKILITPPHCYPKNSSLPILSKTQLTSVPLRNFSAL